ncbi:MAG: DUF1549 and DUF1553 domain-containing protein [Verrucomicrobiota bacterium]
MRAQPATPHPLLRMARRLLRTGLALLPALAAWPAGTDHWAYRPLPRPAEAPHFPAALEREIQRGLQQAGLAAAPEADRPTLARRLHLVLTGLPPTPGELQAFLADPRPDAFERRVDLLLASPRFGERWARHWLDVVRYADSVTLRGFVFREAWRYRDYVVEFFNGDRPLAEFIREQVAGDLLEGGTLAERRRRRVATTFWALGDTNLEEQDKRQLELDVLDEQLDVWGRAFLGQTLSCARCHDHKFDPLPARDYHAVAGILAGTRLLRHANVSEWLESPLPGTPAGEVAWAEAGAEVLRSEKALQAARTALAARPGSSPAGPGYGPDPALLADLPRLEARWAAARAAARRPRVMAPVEAGPTNLPVLRRGNWRQPAETVPRGTLQAAFHLPVPAWSPRQSGRRELAEWMLHPAHPLTARVWVNRAWHWVFGAGLVRTVDNFGTTGDHPTHPELLDALAARFLAEGGPVKGFVRALVQSSAFRRSSDPRHPAVAASALADPDNRWLARFAPRRVEAEVLRDAILQAAGTLREEGGGPPFPAGLAADYGFPATNQFRSLYLPVFRNARPEGLAVFDAADPSRPTGARESSIVAPQALYLLNDPGVRAQATATARRLLDSPRPVDDLWQATLSRPPSAGERQAALAHLQASPDRLAALAELAQAVFGTIDFRRLP